MANQTKYFKTPFAESGTRAEVPNNSVGGAVGFDTGFGPDYELPQGSAGRKRIERDKYNGLHHSITKNLKQWQECLYPTWIEDDGTGMAFSYHVGMIVNHAGQNWVSNEDSNQEEPGTGDKWRSYTANRVARIPTTVAEIENGYFREGDLLEVTDRDNGNFNVVPGTANGREKIDAGNGLVAELVVNGSIRSKQFGLKGDDTDETESFHAFRDYLAANPSVELIFTSGRYSYTTSPNWAIGKTTVSFEGDVTFHNTGVGTSLIFDSGATGLTFDFRFGWGNRVNIEGDPSTLGGVYIRSCHHNKIAANVRGCGAAFDAFRIEFSVLGEYDFVASTNQPNTFVTKPLRGLYVTRRGAGGDLTSACTFYNIIMEGVETDGIVLDYATKNLFLGGTTEGNGNDNLVCTANSNTNTFQGIDLEVAGGVGLRDGGRRNTYNDVFNDNDTIFESTSVTNTINGGIFDAINNQGKANVFNDFSYSSQGGSFTDTGTLTSIENAYFLLGARYFPTNKTQGRNDFIADVAAPFPWPVPLTVPGLSLRAALPLIGVKVGDNITLSSVTNTPAGFITTPSAVCKIDGQIDITFTQITGAAISPLPAGSDFVVSVKGVG